jgi:protein-tyrosine phosphatase
MRSILFVCTANICRSPTAEGVLRHLLAEAGLEGRLEIESAGTHDYHAGKPPFDSAVAIAKKKGYDITGSISRRVASGDFDHFDMILAMDKANISHLRAIAPTRSKQKIELLLEYGDKYHGQEIPDPFSGKEKEFQLALDMIEDGCRGLVELLKRTAWR